jgi:hypothetical protein
MSTFKTLVRELVDAHFACGEWDHNGTSESYDDVSKTADDATKALWEALALVGVTPDTPTPVDVPGGFLAALRAAHAHARASGFTRDVWFDRTLDVFTNGVFTNVPCNLECDLIGYVDPYGNWIKTTDEFHFDINEIAGVLRT